MQLHFMNNQISSRHKALCSIEMHYTRGAGGQQQALAKWSILMNAYTFQSEIRVCYFKK